MKNFILKLLVCCFIITFALFIVSCSKNTNSNFSESAAESNIESEKESDIESEENEESIAEEEPEEESKPSVDEGATYTFSFNLIENKGEKGYEVTGIEIDGYSNVIIPSSYKDLPVIKIGRYAFKQTKTNTCHYIISVDIPDSVIEIDYGAFQDCQNLTSVKIGDGISDLWSATFIGCENLTTLEIGKGVYSIATSNLSAIQNIIVDEENETYKSIDGNLYDKKGNTLKFYAKGKTQEVFTLPDSVTHVGDGAFWGALYLKKIVIGKNLQTIGASAFYELNNIESFEVSQENSFFKSIDGHLYDKKGSFLIKCAVGNGAEDFVVPTSLTKIDIFAMNNYNTIKNIYVSNLSGWFKINGLYAFNYINAENFYLNGELVSEVVVPKNVSEIKGYTFAKFKNIKTIDIGNGVTTVDYSAFSGNNSLQTLKIGARLNDIDWIYRISSLKYIEVNKDNAKYKSIDGNLYSKDEKTLLFYVTDNIKRVIVPASVKTIGKQAFYKKDVKSVTLLGGLERIEDAAFYGTSIESIIVPATVTYIGGSAFESCENLKNVVVLSPNVEIDSGYCYIFRNSKNIESITIPASLMKNLPTDNITYAHIISGEIKDTVFARSKKLEKLVIDSGVTSICQSAFLACKNLKTVIINCKTIGKEAFSGCTGIEKLEIGANVTEICDYAFSGCISIGKIKIGKNVKSIGIYAFAYCNSASCVILGKQVESIGNNAFNGCQSLTAVYYAGTPENFKNIVIGKNGNEKFLNATIYYCVIRLI